MKKTVYILAAILAAAACGKEIAEKQTPVNGNNPATEQPSYGDGTLVSIRAGIGIKAAAEGRASVNDATGVMAWEATDAIGVYTGSEFTKFVIDPTTLSDDYPTFTATLTDGQAVQNVAVFPYNANDAYDGTSLSIELPAVYSSYSGTDTRAIMVATTTADVTLADGITKVKQFSFKHFGAAVKISITDMNAAVDAISVTVPGKKISGTYSIANLAAASEIALEANGSEAEQTVTFELPEVVYRSSTMDIYLPVPTGSLAGLQVKALVSGGAALHTRTINNSYTAARGDLLVFADKSAVSVKVLGGGMGTEASPLLITSKDDLLGLSDYSNSADYSAAFLPLYYQQTADIDLSSVANFTPIGQVDGHSFSGVYDGNGKTINNLTVNATAALAGLFGYLSGATVKDLALSGCSISSTAADVGTIAGYMASSSVVSGCTVSGSVASTSTSWGFGGITGVLTTYSQVTGTSFSGTVVNTAGTRVGGIAGHLSRASISDCTIVSGSTISGTQYTGGIAGYWKSDKTTSKSITGCNVNAAISGTTLVGGIVAYGFNEESNPTVIEDCHILGGSVTGSGATVGGIVGLFGKGDLQISSCSLNSGATVSGTNNVGGIIGYLNGDSTTDTYNIAIGNCVVKGNISGTKYTGGIIANCLYNSTTSDITTTIVVSDCFVSGGITSAEEVAGGIVGGKGSGNLTIKNCKVTSDVKATYYVAGILGYNNLTGVTGKRLTILNCAYTDGVLSNTSETTRTIGGIAGFLRTTTQPNIINCYSNPSKIDCKASGTALTIGGIVAMKNQGKYFPVNTCYSTIKPAVIYVNGTAISDAASYTILGGIFGSNTSGSSNRPAYLLWDSSLSGSGNETDNTTYLVEANNCEALATSAMTDGTLLTKLNAGRTAYNASAASGLEASEWIAGTDSYPTISGLPTGE